MKLLEVQVEKFRNIIDSTPVVMQPDVTCLVGKNESGKTAFLEALYRLNPARPNVAFSSRQQYPAWLEKRDRLAGRDLEQFTPIRAVFEFEDDDRAVLEERFGSGVVTSPQLTIRRSYNGHRLLEFNPDEKRAVTHVVATASLTGALATEVAKVESFEALNAVIDRIEEAGTADENAAQAAAALRASWKGTLGSEDLRSAVTQALLERLPTFFYFAEYSRLPSIVKIRELLSADPASLDDKQLTALALLRLAAADDEYLLNPDYETRKRELENVANALTQDVLKYWSQNPHLRVNPDITKTEERDAENRPIAVLDELHLRIWDDQHLLSLPFHEHSTGFRWFFSFLAAFSEFEFKDARVVILLDEPALGLHARAQKDFLRFINERLAPKHQVVYTTHSPFMIEPGELERVRVVEDPGREDGAHVSSDVLSTDPDTLFPLQGALGYDLAQHLFIAPSNLVVEGTSDYTYLVVMSRHLQELDRTGLDDRWSLVPVGGADYIPTFVALLGMHLDVTVLVDARKAGHQRLSHLAEQRYLAQTRIVTVGEVVGRKEADIEDVFSVPDYLKLYNEAFGTSVVPGDLTGSDRIIRRIERHTGSVFDHGAPADVLLRRRDELLPQLSSATLDRFEKLFEAVNATLPTEGD